MNPQALPPHWQVTPSGQLVIRQTVSPGLIQFAWGGMALSVAFMLFVGLSVPFFAMMVWFLIWTPVFLAGLFLVKTNARPITADSKVGYLELFSEYGVPLLFRLPEITGITPVFWEAGTAPLRVTFCSVAIEVLDGTLLRLPFITTERSSAEEWARVLADFTGRPYLESRQVLVPRAPEYDKLTELRQAS